MSISTSNNSSKHIKKRLNQDQVQLLESSFDAIKKLDPERKFKLARELGVPPRQIAIWYQNKRARWKSQSLELDYSALEVRLQAALTEKKQLEKHLCGLRGELKRAQEMLSASRLAQAEAQSQVNQAWIPPVSSLSSCCDEGGGSSSLNDDVFWSGNWASAADQANLQYEELYACLMMDGKGSNEWNHGKEFWVITDDSGGSVFQKVSNSLMDMERVKPGSSELLVTKLLQRLSSSQESSLKDLQELSDRIFGKGNAETPSTSTEGDSKKKQQSKELSSNANMSPLARFLLSRWQGHASRDLNT